MELSPDKVMLNYAQAYQKLYNRMPKDLRLLDQEWVIVNGARMRVSELEYLTRQLLQEYNQTLGQKRTIISRLIQWLKR